MSLFTKKTNKDFQSKYRELVDGESSDRLISDDTGGFSNHDHFRNYRAAFYGLSALYILSISISLIIWQFGPIFRSQNTSLQNRLEKIPLDQTRNFLPDKQFSTPSSEMLENDPWASLIPAGKGFVEVPVEVTTPEGGTETQSEYFCISVFHQLHCIASLKVAFEKLSSSSTTPSENPETHSMAHLYHCFDYLRQAIMCAGDTTLEPAFYLKTLDTKVVNGWNVEHQCRNYEKIKEYAEDHRFLNSSGIL